MHNTIERWSASAAGRSRMVAFNGMLWVVSTVANIPEVEQEMEACLLQLEKLLREGGSDKTRLLSVQVILSDIHQRDTFDRLWNEWIGPDPNHWPQRAVYGATLAAGLAVEIIATAAKQEL